MESGEFDNGNFRAASCWTTRILLFKKKACLCMDPFYYVVKHVEKQPDVNWHHPHTPSGYIAARFALILDKCQKRLFPLMT